MVGDTLGDVGRYPLLSGVLSGEGRRKKPLCTGLSVWVPRALRLANRSGRANPGPRGCLVAAMPYSPVSSKKVPKDLPGAMYGRATPGIGEVAILGGDGGDLGEHGGDCRVTPGIGEVANLGSSGGDLGEHGGESRTNLWVVGVAMCASW